MPKIWRWIAPIAMAGGMIAAGAVPASADPATTSITIAATSPSYPGAVHGKVFGYALVVYKDKTGNLDAATISGTIKGASSADDARLFAEPFGAKSFKFTGQVLPLPSGSTVGYEFPVKPSVATKYQVRVSNGATVLATSAAATVYVTEGSGHNKITTHCSGGRCTTTWDVYVVVATTKAERTESAKRWYLYFAIDTHLPRLPKSLPRDNSASAARPRRVNALEYEVTLTFRFRTTIKNPSSDILPAGCTKDTESTDGYGLPGHHGCGASKISTSSPYVG
jgi:hypothetical protein